jgi:DMSO/TMAO reductase YedYZ molybdopterin-dependent catalytic subunit
MKPSRRELLLGGTAVGAAAVVGSAVETPPDASGVWAPGHALNYAAHRLIGKNAWAREFSREDISPKPYANGRPPKDLDLAKWRLSIEGMVARPLSLSVDEVRRFPVHSQITHLACEEGWSYIAQWTGARLAELLEHAGALPGAKYVAYFSVQPNWWDSIDIDEARHPQTFVAHTMNGAALPLGHGAPLRMRVPRQLGYKSVKFLNKIVVCESVKQFGAGKGSWAAERGYAWYNGI